MKYQFVKDNEGRFKIEEICSAMGICRSGYYCWRHRAPSARRIEDEGIKGAILKVHKEAKGRDVTAENTTIASESLSGEITGKTYEAKKIHP